ncbi:MAG: flagellar biosynthetic protein FliR [Thermoflavifilum sp.]|nr:flagellar biosynthetic protein FliR [Thermoflavifilum sp.]MCL6513393.1 flagellar biosynthetic protein FliR [Alicyclobacillus sp.]
MAEWTLWLLILCRTAAFVGTAPLFSMRGWPMMAKVGFAAMLALAVLPSVRATVPSPWTDPGSFVLDALRESVTGFALGFIATLLFSAVSIAGGVTDLQSGFGMGGWFEPGFNSGGVLSGVLQTLFMLYFLGVGGLDGWVLVILHSYQWVGVGAVGWPHGAADGLGQLLDLATTLAVELCAPLMVALLLTDLTLAFISRSAPQLNVFVAGLPAKLLVMWLLLAMAMPATTYAFGQVFQQIFQATDAWLHAVGG